MFENAKIWVVSSCVKYYAASILSSALVYNLLRFVNLVSVCYFQMWLCMVWGNIIVWDLHCSQLGRYTWHDDCRPCRSLLYHTESCRDQDTRMFSGHSIHLIGIHHPQSIPPCGSSRVHSPGSPVDTCTLDGLCQRSPCPAGRWHYLHMDWVYIDLPLKMVDKIP